MKPRALVIVIVPVVAAAALVLWLVLRGGD